MCTTAQPRMIQIWNLNRHDILNQNGNQSEEIWFHSHSQSQNKIPSNLLRFIPSPRFSYLIFPFFGVVLLWLAACGSPGSRSGVIGRESTEMRNKSSKALHAPPHGHLSLFQIFIILIILFLLLLLHGSYDFDVSYLFGKDIFWRIFSPVIFLKFKFLKFELKTISRFRKNILKK
jgi:hypothetical protein